MFQDAEPIVLRGRIKEKVTDKGNDLSSYTLHVLA